VSIFMRLDKACACWALLWMCCWPATAGPALPPQADRAARVEQRLAAWEDLEQKISVLTAEAEKLDEVLGPDRQERNWWNPFWWSSAQRRLQRANEIALQLQALDRERRELEQTLLRETTELAEGFLAAEAAPDDRRRRLWQRADAWRIPRLLADPDWASLPAADLRQMDPELLRLRRQALAAALAERQQLETYLAARVAGLAAGEDEEKRRYEAWRTQAQAAENRTRQLLEEIQPAAPAVPR